MRAKQLPAYWTANVAPRLTFRFAIPPEPALISHGHSLRRTYSGRNCLAMPITFRCDLHVSRSQAVDLHLTGQTAVIVGAAQGIGQAIAREFAVEGAQVALLDRDSKVLTTASEMGGTGGCLGLVADATDLESLRQ